MLKHMYDVILNITRKMKLILCWFYPYVSEAIVVSLILRGNVFRICQFKFVWKHIVETYIQGFERQWLDVFQNLRSIIIIKGLIILY